MSGSGEEANHDGKLRSQRVPLIQETRNVEPEQQSFFSRVLEDIHIYREEAAHYNNNERKPGEDDDFQAED